MKREATTLELIVEQKFATAFADVKNITKWEASAVTFAKGAYYVAFDNLHGMDFKMMELLLICREMEVIRCYIIGGVIQFSQDSPRFATSGALKAISSSASPDRILVMRYVLWDAVA